MPTIASTTHLWERAQRLGVKHGNSIYYVLALMAYNVFVLFPEEWRGRIFCGSIAFAMAFVCLYFVLERGKLIDRIFLALSVNNMIEELGFGDPTKFTWNEYISAAVLAVIVPPPPPPP